MKRILKDKRGVAIESAMMFMILVMCLCMLLTSAITFVHFRVKLDDKQYQTRLELDQIGEYFVTEANETDFRYKMTTQYPDYQYNIADNTLTVVTENEKVILYIQKNGTDVLQWRYSAPTE